MNPHPFEARAFDQLDKRLGDLRSEVTALRADVRADIAALRAEVRADIGDQRSDFGGLRSEFGGLRSEFKGLREEMHAGFARRDDRFDSLERKIDANFHATIGWMLGQTTVLVGAMAALVFAIHR